MSSCVKYERVTMTLPRSLVVWAKKSLLDKEKATGIKVPFSRYISELISKEKINSQKPKEGR